MFSLYEQSKMQLIFNQSVLYPVSKPSLGLGLKNKITVSLA